MERNTVANCHLFVVVIRAHFSFPVANGLGCSLFVIVVRAQFSFPVCIWMLKRAHFFFFCFQCAYGCQRGPSFRFQSVSHGCQRGPSFRSQCAYGCLCHSLTSHTQPSPEFSCTTSIVKRLGTLFSVGQMS